MNENLSEPVTDQFPNLSSFATIVRHDGTYLMGAGLLADGLIVPLFPNVLAAQEIVDSLIDDPRDLKLRVSSLGDPFKAMHKAAGEGAAGFQFSSGLFTDEQREAVFKETAGRIVFPFMTRREEAGGLWPTVLGTAHRCDAGVYLTRRGQTHFGAHDLCQWIRWDVMDRASAKLAVEQPLRSHEPGDPFWCLSHAAGSVHFVKAGERYRMDVPAVVLFACDTVLRQFMPPEGYYPVFTSEEAAVEFLTQRLGGAFHILSLAESPYPNLVMHEGLMAQDLGSGGALIALTERIDDLPRHLKLVRETFKLPNSASFVVNPAGHREDVAWGRFATVDEDGLTLKSAGARWKLSTKHQYSEIGRVDQFDGEDTFFLGPSEFRFAELRRGAVLRSFRVSLCSNVADALISHIADEARSSDRLMDEMGLPEELREKLVELIEADVDPEGDQLLRRRVEETTAEHISARTRLFLATALLQFESMGRSPCLDYAPVSVQVVKALEFEMRELASAAVCGYSGLSEPESLSREEETLFHILANRRHMVSLGSITYAFKAMRNAQAGILQHAANQLRFYGLLELTTPRTVKLIINDVLNRYRNGGAHDQAISYATCQECIDTLVGTHDRPGLIFRVSRWRGQQTN